MSIREDQLHGVGFAVTLTLRDCPATAVGWQRLRNAWAKRMRRLGMVRLHWVTEWQRRGVPHLHGAIWFDGDVTLRQARDMAISHWLEVAQDFSAAAPAQYVHAIDGPVGWFQYMSKHAARGVSHYQRCQGNMPDAWANNTGRIWGHWGDWPTQSEVRVELQDERAGGDKGWYAYRRLCRAWRISDARASGDLSRIVSAKRMLFCGDRYRSPVIGFMEWIPYEVHMAFLANLAGRGFFVSS